MAAVAARMVEEAGPAGRRMANGVPPNAGRRQQQNDRYRQSETIRSDQAVGIRNRDFLLAEMLDGAFKPFSRATKGS